MPDVKISTMTPGAALDGSELFEMTQAGDTFSTDGDAIKTWCSLGPLTFVEVVGSSALTITGATQTTSQPVVNATQTWNAGGVTFTGIKLNVTNTASAAASMLIDLQLGGTTQFNVTRAGVLTTTGSHVFSAAAAGPTLKQGANGRVGTFVCNGATPVTVNNTSIEITDAIIISLNTVGGTVGAVPAVKTITASSGFTVAGTASDTSTYNYAIIKNAV